MSLKEIVSCTIFSIFIVSADAQSIDSIQQLPLAPRNPFPVKSFLIPAGMVVYGFIALKTDALKDIDENLKEEVWTDHPHRQNHIDYPLQFAPAIAVYVLNFSGIHGKNNLRDRSMIYVLSNVVLNSAVFSLKKITHEKRPDGSDRYSFPSGHTAEAFASAEFMRQEYKDISPWYGAAGYTMAIATGYFRTYNNKHWLSDVVAGAGIGIASTKLAYWLYPTIRKKLFNDKHPNEMLIPFYQNRSAGLSFVYQF